MPQIYYGNGKNRFYHLKKYYDTKTKKNIYSHLQLLTHPSKKILKDNAMRNLSKEVYKMVKICGGFFSARKATPERVTIPPIMRDK